MFLTFDIPPQVDIYICKYHCIITIPINQNKNLVFFYGIIQSENIHTWNIKVCSRIKYCFIMYFVNSSTSIVPYGISINDPFWVNNPTTCRNRTPLKWWIHPSNTNGSGKCRSLHLNWIFELLSHSTDDFDTFLGLSGKSKLCCYNLYNTRITSNVCIHCIKIETIPLKCNFDTIRIVFIIILIS